MIDNQGPLRAGAFLINDEDENAVLYHTQPEDTARLC